MDERTEHALREIVTIVGRAFTTGCTMLSADDGRAIAEVLERSIGATSLMAVKELAAEAYALEYPLHGRDVALTLIEPGLMTPSEFAEMVGQYDPAAASAILRPAEPAPAVAVDPRPV
jgi:hypothetical protein